MEQSIIYGNDNFHYSEIITSEGGAFEFAKPVRLEGMRSFSMSVEQSVKKVPADNATFVQIPGQKVREAEGTFLTLTEEYARLIGYHKNANGMISDTGKQVPHAIMFEETISSETEDSRILHILYHVTAGEPSMETTTLDEEPEEREIAFAYSPITSRFVKDDQGKYAQYANIKRTTENAEFYDSFTERVLLPSETIETI